MSDKHIQNVGLPRYWIFNTNNDLWVSSSMRKPRIENVKSNWIVVRARDMVGAKQAYLDKKMEITLNE